MQQDLQRLRQWLVGFGGGVDEYRIDFAHSLPAGGAVYPKGLEHLETRQNILGRRVMACQYNFTVYRTFVQDEGGGAAIKAAQEMLDLQNWVQQESAAGRCPRFGNMEEDAEEMWAESGQFVKQPQSGVGLYSMQLHAKFKREYGG